ncbi:hypothetical protein [Pseudogulbenkiania subflava]|uniref:hypothetical protein n=1 Tax=Pseudogulbenkiania subflava TaxID=451637 RepID=UPI0013564BA3|nr:hypothetical protein [Pseudogulbenkiania subflava]
MDQAENRIMLCRRNEKGTACCAFLGCGRQAGWNGAQAITANTDQWMSMLAGKAA